MGASAVGDDGDVPGPVLVGALGQDGQFHVAGARDAGAVGELGGSGTYVHHQDSLPVLQQLGEFPYPHAGQAGGGPSLPGPAPEAGGHIEGYHGGQGG